MQKPVILCVDDDKTILDSLRGQLSGAFGDQFVYEGAEDAEEALEVLDELENEEHAVVLIVSDWLMPRIKGDEFLIEVHQKYPLITSIMLTGQADETAIENARTNGGMLCCIAKPWKKEDLIQKIEEILINNI